MILHRFFLKLAPFMLCLLGLFSLPCLADDKTQYQQKLDSIRNNINNVEDSLTQDKTERGTIQLELKKLDSKIATISKELDYTALLIKKYQQNLKTLNNDLAALEIQLNKQKSALSQQVKAAFMMGKHESFKLILNQQNATEMGHAFVYYDYLNKTRSQQILQFNTLLDEKTALKDRINSKSIELAGLHKTQLKQKSLFNEHRASRNQLLRQLNTKIMSNEEMLSSLQNHRKQIENLLMSLGEILADIPPEPANTKAFASLKGQLPWPLSGRIQNQFGATRDRSDLKWNGVILSSDYGTPVHAINNGRVIFSDWLQGYGFIIILDHGNGYMTLYGYNQNLLKQTGDWVTKGDVIATVGDSGGQESSGLYFEIRQQGKPINPKDWCSIKYTSYANR